jgi:Dolichyl-phosphate-mannose-protein mannosyltransferase
VAVVLLALAALAKIPTLPQPLTENFAWRQTQTAFTALIYHREGIDLLHPQVPVHGPPWYFGFEFPLFQAFGALLMDVGLPADIAMRSLGLATFLLTGWLLYRLIAHVADDVAALVALGAFLFSPFGLLWGRTSLIEYLATAASLGYLLGGIRWLDRGRPLSLAVSLGSGVVAMLVKITTGAFYLLPLLAYRPANGSIIDRKWSLAALIVVPAIVGRLWIAYTDALKASQPATVFQTSGEMINFNFGTPEMRIDPAVWAPIGAVLLVGLTGAGLLIWLLMAIARLRSLRQGPFFAALFVAAIVAPPIVLTPLYSTQNYYPVAISPAVAALVGLGASWAWEHRRRLAARIGLGLAVALWVATIGLTSDYWLDSYRPVVDRDGSLAAADFIRERSEPDDWIVVEGRGWDPTVLYYADRRGYMIDARRDDETTIDALRSDARYTLFVECPYEGTCQVMPED